MVGYDKDGNDANDDVTDKNEDDKLSQESSDVSVSLVSVSSSMTMAREPSSRIKKENGVNAVRKIKNKSQHLLFMTHGSKKPCPPYVKKF